MQADARTLAPLGTVLPMLLASATAEVAAWALACVPGTLGGAWYGRPEVLAVVHLLTLGTLATAIVGAGWQILPVVTTRAWRPRAAPVLNAALLVAIPGLIAGFFSPGPVGHAAVGIVVTALVARCGLVLATLAKAEGRAAARVWLACAELSLLAGLGVAIALWAGRAGHPVFTNPIAGIEQHVAWLLGGWVGGWIVGAGGLLLPMFAVGPEPDERLLGGAAAAWFGGIALGVPALWLVGAILAGGTLLASLARGVRLGVPLAQAATGLCGLAIAGVLAILGRPDAAGAAALALCALPVLRGVAQRIVPFFAWTHAFGSRPRGAPSVASLVPAWLARVQAGVSLGGGLLLVATRLDHPDLAGLAAAALLFGAIAHLALLATALVRVSRHTHRRQTLAGMGA